MQEYTFKQNLLLHMAPIIGKLVIHFIGKTSRIIALNTVIEQKLAQEHGSYIIAFWHGRQFMLVYTHRNQDIHVLVSKSFDGELISRTIHKFGIPTIRGSSSRGGGKALETLVKLAESNHKIAFTPDGPRGPAHVVAHGVIVAASRSGKPILPLTVGAKRKTHLNSWDKFMIPHPFTNIVIIAGTPISVPPDLDPDGIELYRQKLKTELDNITQQADTYF